MQKDTDWQLVEDIVQGDDKAFNLLMNRYKKPVLSFIYRFLGNPAEAEDVAQDVFVKAYQAIRNNGVQRQGKAFSTWLFQVARNAAIDRFRWLKRRPADSLSAMQDNGWDTINNDRNPYENTEADELQQEIATAIAELPEKQRTALILFEYEDLSYEEIAKILECQKKSVENHLYRARQSLKPKLRSFLGLKISAHYGIKIKRNEGFSFF